MSQAADSAESARVTPAQLKKFLTDAPLMYNNRLHKGAQKHILTHCYRALWSNDLDMMQKYFFKEGLTDNDNLSQLLEKYNLFGSKQDLGHEDDNEPEYLESQRGKQCGHLFKKGESVYRCRNCGLDDTCVMCSKCFHATNHDGHDIKIWISKGAGGCCDCGDPEAWKIPLECKIHSAASSSDIPNSSTLSTETSLDPISSIPDSLMNSVRETMVVIINYILETFATSPEDVASSPEEVSSVEDIQRDCVDSHEALGLPVDLETQTYSCILWNDEKHSFNEVIRTVRHAIDCTSEEAGHVAECVDLYGRHIIKESTNISELIEIAKIVSSIHLAVTICSSQKTVREEIAGLLLDWLKELIGSRYKFFNQVEGGNNIMRDMICKVLSEDWHLTHDLAVLTTRARRTRMPDNESDEFELEGDGGNDMDEDDVDEDDIIQLEDIDENMLMDEDGLDEFLNVISGEAGSGTDEGNSSDEYEDASEMSSGIAVPDHHISENEDNTAMETDHTDSQEAFSSQEAPSNYQATRRRESRANSVTPVSTQYAEMLKRRRLSNSSQSKPNKSTTHKTRDILDMDWSLDQWLERTEKLESDEIKTAQQLGIPYATANNDISATRRINGNLKKEFKRKLRLDYLLQFDLRLWKIARISIKDLLIGTFISNFDYRPILGIRFARNYPELLDAFFFKDREPENSVSTLSVQLLTVPTVALLLVKDYKFFGIVCSILQNFFLTDEIHMLTPEDKEYAGSQVDCTTRAIGRHRYAYTIFDLRYVMNAEPVRLEISKNPIYLRQFVDMLYQFQAMDPHQRKTDTHVEYESQSWIVAFNITLQTSKLYRLFAGCFDPIQNSETTITESSRNLCRAIYRVLKAISDWDPHPAPLKNASADAPDNRVIIKGLSHQKYHQVNTPNAGSFSIVEYDVAQEPVSIHHPYHWLLSELFKYVSLLHQGVLNELGWLDGFKQMVNDALPSKDHDMFLTVLDYPIRTFVVLSQINCGVWVRNGFAIRNMCISYRDTNVRENTLDCDIYLMQVGFTVCNSDQILMTLIDRAQLTDWFRGKPGKKSVYEASQKTYMVEEFLNLLIIIATEHSYASGATVEQRIRQSIIQFLGIKSMAYSELLKLIPESLNEHESFESELNLLANFKAPDGFSDKGLYEIKPEYVDEMNPYFWHYTRNEREEAHNVLKKRWNQLHPNEKLADKDEFLLVPKTNRIESGPFRHLGKFLHSHTLCQIIVYSLCDAKFHKESKSDTILDEALYLGMLAVTDQNSTASELAAMNVKGKYRADILVDESNTINFIDYAVTDEYAIQINEIEMVRSSLLVVLLRCMNDTELEHAHKRISFIVDKIEQNGSDKARNIIAEWKERKALEIKCSSVAGGDGMSEYERKKAAAKARQAAIMSQFANAQTKFMEKHSDLYKTEDEDIADVYQEISTANNDTTSDDELEIVRKCHFPADTCIVCQEELDDTKLYGTLGLIQRSNTQRYAVMDDKEVLADILESSNLANPWAPKEDTSPPFTGFPTEAHRSGLDISSCGHLMHSECFDTYQKSVDNQILSELSRLFPLSLTPKSRFLCPLCKALGNVLVPVVWKGKTEAYPGVMAPTSPYASFGKSIKDILTDLETKIKLVPGSFDEEVPFSCDNDPNLIISDQTKLKQIYNKLMKTIRSTSLGSKTSLDTALNLYDSIQELQDMYADTISAFEIAQRGIEGTRARDLTAEHTGTFIDDVPNTSQLLLKILGMTNLLIPKLMNSPWQTEERCINEKLALKALNQFMPGNVNEPSVLEKTSADPMLCDDPFRTFVRLSFSVTQDSSVIEPHHVLRSVYLAELTKIIILLVDSVNSNDKLLQDPKIKNLLDTLNSDQRQAVGSESIQQFATYVCGLLNVPQEKTDHFFKAVNPGALIALVRTFALPFLRKSLLLMVVQHGFIPQNPTDEMIDEKNEFDHLLDILRLPTLESTFELASFEQALLTAWCTDYLNHKQDNIKLALPTKLKMVTLPYRLDQLIDESSKRPCRKCKTVPDHSAICLICGTFVCAHRFCCTEGNKGECNTHMKTCGGEIGIYIMIKECYLLLLHDNGGNIMSAPYLDSHGEADIHFKRGAPQFLNNKRYEQIRQMWLNQSIPSFVRRKMEAAYSGTIWETF